MRQDATTSDEHDGVEPADRPVRTAPVLALLVLAAGLFSYLGGYAVVGALLAAELINPWPPDRDPRPRWALVSFALMLLTLSALAWLLRRSSRRQLQRIDDIQND